MATKTAKPDGTSLQTVEDKLDGFRFTLNLRNGNEALTIRTNDETELETLREKWKPVIAPDRKKLPYLHIGDPCQADNCDGKMELRNSTNRKSGQPYSYLRCDHYPECQFMSYVEPKAKEAQRA